MHEGLLALQTLRWPTDLKDVDFGPSRTTISAKERKMSAALVEQFNEDFDPEQFADKYQEQLRELVDAKLEKGDAVATGATFGEDASDDSAGDGKVISMMDALERSVQKRRSAESSGTERSSRSTTSSGARTSSGTEKRPSTTKKTPGSTKKASRSTTTSA